MLLGLESIKKNDSLITKMAVVQLPRISSIKLGVVGLFMAEMYRFYNIFNLSYQSSVNVTKKSFTHMVYEYIIEKMQNTISRYGYKQETRISRRWSLKVMEKYCRYHFYIHYQYIMHFKSTSYVITCSST